MAALLRLVMFALFVFLIVTVAAFVYLEWWQAILVSAGTFLGLIYLAKVMVRAAVGKLQDMAMGLFRVKSGALKGATVDVHAVRHIAEPQGAAAAMAEDETTPLSLAWYEIEFTLFPPTNPIGPMAHWDVDELRLVPANAAVPDVAGNDDVEDEASPWSVEVFENGNYVEPDGSKFHGPQRLRAVVGFAHGIKDWKFRYYFESFGHLRLPAAALQ